MSVANNLSRRVNQMRSPFQGLALSAFIVVSVAVTAGSAHAQDPTAPGPFAVLTTQYDHGDTAFTCGEADGCTGTVANAEIRAEVYYPSNLAAGPFPLLVFLHGNHLACYNPGDGTVDFFGTWPCPGSMVPIPSYRGYDYIGRNLASHGYIVASISADGINARSPDSSGSGEGIPERGHLVDAHLRLWSTFNTTGSPADPQPFASALIGKVDMNHVGTMGHSRGGDGVVNHFATFGAASTPYKVRAVFPIAPTTFVGSVASDVNLGVLLSYCDGDVFTLEGTLFYDRARYVDPLDPSGKHTFLAMGGDHNFYNTVWTPDCWNVADSCWSDPRGLIPQATTDDYPSRNMPDFSGTDPLCGLNNPSNIRLTPASQRLTGLAMVAAFFRYYIGGETAFASLLRGDTPPQAPVNGNLFVGYQPPAAQRLDLNRFSNDSELTSTTLVGSGGLRGAVVANSLETYQRCGFDQGDPCFGGVRREAHRSDFVGDNPTLSRVLVSWDDPSDTLVNNLPAGARDVSRFDTIQFRTGLDYRDARNMGSFPARELSVVLEDARSQVAVSTAAQLGNNDLGIPPGEIAPTAVMNTLRLPLDSFRGINLADLRRVTLRFDRTSGGTILFSDVAFAGQPVQPSCQASQSFVVGDRASVSTSGSTGPAILNSGSGETRISTHAHAVGIISVGPVNVLDQATVNGRIVSAGTVSIAPTATVNGPVSSSATVSLPGLPTLPTFPPATGGSFFVNTGNSRSPAPGSYANVSVSTGGTLNLASGDYFFTTLTLNAGSTVHVTASTRIYVQSTLNLGVTFTTASNVVQPILLGFAGTSLNVNVRFDGTLVAPNAILALGSGSPITFTGSFFARVLQLNNDMSLVCTPSPVTGTGPTASCSNGVRDGNETDIDCGGSVCPRCANGKTCRAGSDCTSNTCTGGRCSPPGNVTASLSVFTDWGGGYCATVHVTNGAALPTTSWSVSLDLNQSSIYTSWNGRFSGSSGVISVTPGFDWNRVIPAGASNDSVGFCVNRNVPNSGTRAFVVGASGSF